MKEKIYLIPGLMTDERLWQRLKPLLSEYELVHLSIPLLEDFDEINNHLLKILKNETKINLLGFSLGGYIAFYFSLKYPNKVKKLFLVASTPSASNEDEIVRRREKITQIEKNGFDGLSYEKAKSLLDKQNQDDEELIHIVCDMFNDLGEESFIIQLNATFNRLNLIDELKTLDLPIYLSYCKEDRLLNKKAIRKLEKEEHNIIMLPKKGTSHMISLEFPEILSLEIKEWMSID